MTDFITRIELHGASPDEYARLHGEMAARGFTRQIVSGEGVIFGLPTAMYLFKSNALSNFTAEQVRNIAKSAADVSGLNSWILTVAYTDAAWFLNTVQRG